MQVTKHLHAVRIPFQIPLSPEKALDRFVYAFICMAETITLIDSGVAGADFIIFDAIREHGRDPAEIAMLILSHSHPDHLGAARAVKNATGCRICAHANERLWIEDTQQQFQDRPVPGFQMLVGGPVPVDRVLRDGETVELGQDLSCTVIHTPGHSAGSISLLLAGDKTLFTGDALPLPGDLPIYENIVDCVQSIRKLQDIDAVQTLLSSWEPPVVGQKKIQVRMAAAIAYLEKIHGAVLAAATGKKLDMMELCRQVVAALGLPPAAANPLVARSFASSLAAGADHSLFAV
ncbi:MAG: MBL fold metallo-hydrolase [Proteobacteria bacterium]|nr:MBL fold metallo-hydrolase [Pseudomonadota bacterium]MBU4294751.1 MBL fold metallo-hydrolase [Pseudomonadota bacterium]MCG2749797.1 MBL fold metallo-hydrolase [Desulfobulbaceae bacterium]